MKRKLSIILALILVLTTLAGCGSNNKAADTTNKGTSGSDGASTGQETADSKEPITLKWAVWDISATTYYQPLIDAYEKAHENVTIEMVDFGSTDYMTVLATELTGNDSDIDIATIKDIPGYTTLVEKNALEPLNDRISSAGLDLSGYGGITDQIKMNDNLYALPFRSDFWVLFYNKDIFDKAGAEYPTNDLTFEQYDSLARSVTDTTPGAQVYGAHYHIWRSAVQLFGILDGKNSVVSGNYDFTKPYYEMVLNQQKDQICQDYATLKTSSLHYSGAFAQGNVAMMNMGTWFIPTLISKIQSGEYAKMNWGIAKYPHAEGVEPGSTLATITSLSVTAASKQKDAAFDFLKFVCGTEGAEIIANTGTIPAIKNDTVINSIASMEGFPADDTTSRDALATANTYLEMPVNAHSSEIETILNAAHDSIMSENMTIDEGIEYMNTEVQKLLK